MLNGDGNEKGKNTLHVQYTFLISLPLFRTTTAWNFLWVTPFNKDNVACAHKIFCFLCSFLLFFHCRSFSPRWSLAFLIFSPPLYNFHVVVPVKFVSFVLYLSFLLFLCYPRKCRLKIRLFCYFFSLWKSEWQFTAKTRGCLKCDIWHGLSSRGWTDGHVGS